MISVKTLMIYRKLVSVGTHLQIGLEHFSLLNGQLLWNFQFLQFPSISGYSSLVFLIFPHSISASPKIKTQLVKSLSDSKFWRSLASWSPATWYKLPRTHYCSQPSPWASPIWDIQEAPQAGLCRRDSQCCGHGHPEHQHPGLGASGNSELHNQKIFPDRVLGIHWNAYSRGLIPDSIGI